MTTSELLLTLSDIAALAHVQRPVVSVWRSRSAQSPHPFPLPSKRENGQEFFSNAEVCEWLVTTGRGNNPQVSADAAAFASPEGASDNFLAIASLLALRSTLGTAFGAMSVADVLDAADEEDPDDTMIYGDIKAASGSIVELAAYVDQLVESAFGEAAAFELLLAGQVKADPNGWGASALSEPALTLLASTVTAMAASQAGDSLIVDVAHAASDVIIDVFQDEVASQDLAVMMANDGGAAGRMARRRLLVHRVQNETVELQEYGALSVQGSAVFVSLNITGESVHVLNSIEETALQLDRGQVAIVLAASAALSDANLSADAERARSAILRSGRLRAIVKLPAGVLKAKPQQGHTLWVIGDSQSSVELADRYTMAADLSAVRLDDLVVTELVGDLVASLGRLSAVRAHAFRFTRLVLTRTLLASRDSLVAAVGETKHLKVNRSAENGAALGVRVDALLASLSGAQSPSPLAQQVLEATTLPTQAPVLTVGQLIALGDLSYVAGNRLEQADIGDGVTTPSGLRVIGAAELMGEGEPGSRRIDPFRFAAAYPAGRVTEPGDVVFLTGPKPTAFVDVEGTSVVMFPARVLRINPSRSNGLLSEVIAADVSAQAVLSARWRRWGLRRVPQSQEIALASALDSIRLHHEQATLRLAQLDELASTLITGISSGAMALTISSAPPVVVKGTK
jgi:hypothetical protein